MSTTVQEILLSMDIADEYDIPIVQQESFRICRELGMNSVEATQVTTAVCELARNMVAYAGGGGLKIIVEDKKSLVIVAEDNGPGIECLNEILEGRFKSKTGLGMGLRCVKKLMDEMTIETEKGKGTKVICKKSLSGSHLRE